MTRREINRFVEQAIEGGSGFRMWLPFVIAMYALLGLFWLLQWPIAAWALIIVPLALAYGWLSSSRRYAAARSDLHRRGAPGELIERAILRQRRRMRRRYGVLSRHDRTRPPHELEGERLRRWRAESRRAHRHLRALFILGAIMAPLFGLAPFALNRPGASGAVMMSVLAILSVCVFWKLLWFLCARSTMLAVRNEGAPGVVGALSRPIGKRGHREG